MLTLLLTPEPALPLDPARWPAEAADALQPLAAAPRQCAWIVPTGRRKRHLLLEAIGSAAGGAVLLPSFHTLESFVAQALEYSLEQRPRLAGPERLLRLARAWQDATGAVPGPGLVQQLARFVRDWQAAGLPPPEKPAHPFEKAVRLYLDGLQQDGKLDRMDRVVALTREIQNDDSWPNRLFLNRLALVVVDGFHLLEKVELELCAALSRRAPVVLRLIGAKGQPEWATLEESAELLGRLTPELKIIDATPIGTPVAQLGRSLFTAREPAFDKLDALCRLEADSIREEVEAVAARIKADYRDAEARGEPYRLSEVAVVLPGPGYDPVVREVFPRAGLEFNLAGRALQVSTSRPARVLEAALVLIRSRWRHERLLDFLNHPLVRRELADGHRLGYLFTQRPRVRRRLDLDAWLEHWQAHFDRLEARIVAWENDGPLPEGSTQPREVHLARTRDLRDSCVRLRDTLEAVLRPVAWLEEALEAPADTKPMAGFADACVRFLETLRIEAWLTPPRHDPEQLPETPHPLAARPEVPWVEFEKDQQAYFKLIGILRTLADLPAERLPGRAGSAERWAALDIALCNETYQIRTEDDAGVQLFELREIRGLRFRHVYALGLLDGQLPPLPEEGIPAQRRGQFPELVRQQAQREREYLYLFRQLFEAADERLVLSRPVSRNEERTLPSRFLSAVLEQVEVPLLEPAGLVSSPREAARLIGADVGNLIQDTRNADILSAFRARRDAWHARPDFPEKVRLDAPALVELFFHHERAVSPSELETYAACPFRYFGLNMLRLAERDPDQSRMHYGLLVHRVLQRLYVELRAAFNGPADAPLPALADAQRDRLLELFEEEWSGLDAGLVPPDLRTLFRHDQGVLQLGIEALKLIEAEHGNLLNEQPVRNVPLGTDAAGRPIALSGKVDRVDVRRDERRQAIVVDYKTGKPKTRKELTEKIADGRLIQLPLYAHALRETLGLDVTGAAYLHLSEREEKPSGAVSTVGTFKLKGQRLEVPFDVPAAVRTALELVGGMRAGDVSLTEHADECAFYCPLRHACRKPGGYRTSPY